jgi:hypothetical protein
MRSTEVAMKTKWNAAGWCATWIAFGALGPALAEAQIASVVHGRVEDALTFRPLAGALVRVVDSDTSVEADSLGAFTILIEPGEPFALEIGQFGYLSERFELDEEAPARISVFRLEPEALELEGLHVLAETALETLLSDLKGRRASYPAAVTVLDRTRLEMFGDMTVWDLIRTRVPTLYECGEGWSGLCVPGRARTLANPSPEVPVQVCIDGQRSWAGVADLTIRSLEEISLIEIFGQGRGGIWIYTPQFIVRTARDGRRISQPLVMGC